jgi:hypothetical protein
MYSFLSKLLMSGKLKFNEGRITAFNQPFSLVPMVSIKAMTDDAVDGGIRSISQLYFYGWIYGYEVTKELEAMFNLKKFEERYQISMQVASMVGFGDFKTSSFERGKLADFRVLKNPFALQYYKSNNLVCHYLRGMEAGGGTIVHETIMNNIEFECTCNNGEFCHHKNLSMEKLNEVDKKLVDSQLDLNYLLDLEKKYVVKAGDSFTLDADY